MNDAYKIGRYDLSGGIIDHGNSMATVGDFETVIGKSLNEIKDVELSSITEDSVYSLNTLYGSMKYCLEKLTTAYPRAFIVGICPFACGKQGGYGNQVFDQNLSFVRNIYKQMKKMYSYYGIPVIDAFAESGIASAYEQGGSIGYRYTIDGIHTQNIKSNPDNYNKNGKLLLKHFMVEKFKRLYLSKNY